MQNKPHTPLFRSPQHSHNRSDAHNDVHNDVHNNVQIDPKQAASNDSSALSVISEELSALVKGDSIELHLEQEADFCRLRSRIRGLLSESKHPSDSLIADLLQELEIQFSKPSGRQQVRLPILNSMHRFELNYYQTAQGQSLTITRCFAKVPGSLDQTNLQPHCIDTLRGLLDDQPNGHTLFVCNTPSAMRDIYYAMLHEANDIEHKVVSLESEPDAHLTRVNQIKISDQQETLNTLNSATQYADRIFINTGDILRIDHSIIDALKNTSCSANIFVSGSSTAMVLKQLANMNILAHHTGTFVTRFVELHTTRLICPHCADFKCLSDRDQQWLDSGTLYKCDDAQRAFNTANGCERCEHTGCAEELTLMNVSEINKKLVKLISTTSVFELSTALQSTQGERSIRYQHEGLARQGAVRFEDFRRGL